jgi:hypothetical protein
MNDDITGAQGLVETESQVSALICTFDTLKGRMSAARAVIVLKEEHQRLDMILQVPHP